jgi:hypothetical protein
VFCYHVEEFGAGNGVELVGEVKEDCCVGGWLVCSLGCINEFLDCKLHCLDDERRPVGNANGVIIGEEVGCEF